MSMTSPSPLNAGAIIVKCVQTPSPKPYQWRPRNAVAKSCLHFQFCSFAFSTEHGLVEELLSLVKHETRQGLWKLRMGRTAVQENRLKTPDSTLAAILFRIWDHRPPRPLLMVHSPNFGASIKSGTWNIPEHSGTSRNIPEHRIIMIIMRKISEIKFS